MIGTARTNPGKHVSSPEHLKDPELVAPLRRVYEGLCSLEIDALISIGGDDTLKTANKLKMFQDNLPGMRVVFLSFICLKRLITITPESTLRSGFSQPSKRWQKRFAI